MIFVGRWRGRRSVLRWGCSLCWNDRKGGTSVSDRTRKSDGLLKEFLGWLPSFFDVDVGIAAPPNSRLLNDFE